MPSKAVHASILDEICGEIKSLQNAVWQLQNRKIKTLPLWNKAHLPHNIVDGQLFFAVDSEQFGIRVNDNVFYADTNPTPYG